MPLEDTLDRLNQTLESQGQANEQLVMALQALIAQEQSSISSTAAIRDSLQSFAQQANDSNRQSVITLQRLADESRLIGTSTQAFQEAAVQTQQSVSEMGHSFI